jgi:F-type H+-transporting ATPase subunit b
MMFFLKSSCFFAFSQQALLDLANRFGIRWDLLLLQSVNFAAMALLLYVLAFRPVLRIMEERREKIATGLSQAETAKDKLLEAEKLRQQILKGAHNEAQHIITEARERAKSYGLEQRKAAQTRAESLVAQAREVIFQEREQMLEEVHHQMSEMVTSLAERVLECHMSVSERKRYMQSTQTFLDGKTAR